jgi:hypothetical protein
MKPMKPALPSSAAVTVSGVESPQIFTTVMRAACLGPAT